MLAKIYRNKKAFIALIIIGSFLLLGLLSPLLAPYDPTAFHMIDRFSSPTRSFLFGTDRYGRDVFSRILIGSRNTFYIGIIATSIGIFFGSIIGLTTGFLGKTYDEVVMRFNDGLLSVPSLVTSLLIIAVLGPGLRNALLAIGIVFIPRVARVVRSATMNIKREQFIDAARARGESSFYIIFREVLPNIWPTIIVEFTYRIGFAIFLNASLSFLGLGVQPPHPDWGLMIREARGDIYLSPWPLIFPALAIVIIITSFNLLGDGLNEIITTGERR